MQSSMTRDYLIILAVLLLALAAGILNGAALLAGP